MQRVRPEEQPFLSWCLIVRNCERSLPGGLEKCLKSLRARTPNAEIVIVDTLSSDAGFDVKLAESDLEKARKALTDSGFRIIFAEGSTLRVGPANMELPGATESIVHALKPHGIEPRSISWGPGTVEISQRYADVFEEYSGPEGTWTREMDAFDNAAAARQRSFELAHGKWRAWIDADDELPGPEEVEKILKVNGRWKPESEGKVDDKVPEIATLEDLIRHMEEAHPKVDNIGAPYLYQLAPDGVTAVRWQERERIVRWERDGKAAWRWAESAHEVLVPIDMQVPHQPARFEHLLFVHNKRWTAEDSDYSVRRHYQIFKRAYDRGERTPRALRYLAIYAPAMCPELHGEFVEALRASAISPLDHYRAQIAAGDYAASRGLYVEALVAYGAATSLRPELPDAWVRGARAAKQAGDLGRAATWLARACDCKPDWMDSDISPREHAFALPSEAALALQEYGKAQRAQGLLVEASANLDAAASFALKVFQSPNIGSDAGEARILAAKARNLAEGEHIALAIEKVWDYLRRNDETMKAADLLHAAPHTLEDHPLLAKLRRDSQKVEHHVTDPDAYDRFYETLPKTDAIPTADWHEDWLTPEHALPRVRTLIHWLNEHPGLSRVVEIGSYDGVTAIPVLRGCPHVHYVAVEANEEAAERLKEYAKKYVSDGDARLTVYHSAFPAEEVCTRLESSFDVAVVFEVLEHVPDPAAFLNAVVALLGVSPDSASEQRIWISTPWGAFDYGSPDESAKPRDPRGHVRAFTAREFRDLATSEALQVEELYQQHTKFDAGNSMVAVLREPEFGFDIPNTINFAVRSALWDWNGREVVRTGIGASEETIVYLADRLAKSQPVDVYGPVPEEEVLGGVGYWTREKLARLKDGDTVVVSRAPSYGREIEKVSGAKLRKILWLQDAWYADLNPEIAADYEKIVVLTEWHKRAMHEQHGVPLEQMVIINNFLLREHFTLATKKVAGEPAVRRFPHHFIYSSSPDRGLVTLLKMWPRILDLWPDATLSIFYGWEGCMKLANTSPQWSAIYKELRGEYDKLRFQRGVMERGRVNHQQLALEMMAASVWAYPTHFAETGCLTAAKVMAAGCIPVTTPLAGLAETGASKWTRFVYQNAIEKDYVDEFIAAVKEAVEVSDSDRAEMSRWAIEKFDIASEALPRWAKLLS